MRSRDDGGQSSVELIGMLPLLVIVALGVGQLLAAGAGRELAGHAAENGAIALGEGEDAEDAVRDALPGWAKHRVRVKVSGRRVQVRLTPVAVFPGIADDLSSEALADAGPEIGTKGAVTQPTAATAGGGLGAVSDPTRDEPVGLEEAGR